MQNNPSNMAQNFGPEPNPTQQPCSRPGSLNAAHRWTYLMKKLTPSTVKPSSQPRGRSATEPHTEKFCGSEPAPSGEQVERT